MSEISPAWGNALREARNRLDAGVSGEVPQCVTDSAAGGVGMTQHLFVYRDGQTPIEIAVKSLTSSAKDQLSLQRYLTADDPSEE